MFAVDIVWQCCKVIGMLTELRRQSRGYGDTLLNLLLSEDPSEVYRDVSARQDLYPKRG